MIVALFGAAFLADAVTRQEYLAIAVLAAGILLMARAGFDPRESVTLWQNMASASGGQSPPEFMSTHPSHATRISKLRAEIPKALGLYEQAVADGRRPNCQ